MELSVLDLFSGIGGFSLGLEATGKFKTIAFCEKDKFCQKVLQKHWQGTKIYEDIRDLDGTKIKADVITGGFPCQPFSQAGKRKGTDDDRYLFPEMLRVIKETQARWIVGENVQGIVNMSEGKVLQGIHNDLETIGYEVQTFIIPASSQGAWHKRNRVWIVAANSKIIWSGEPRNINQEKGNQSSSSTQFNSSSKDVSNTNNTRFKNRNEQHWGKQTQSQERNGSSSRQDIVSNTKKFGMERLWAVRQQKPEIYGKEKISLWSSKNKEQSWWQTQSRLCGVPNGISYEPHKDRVNRIKSLGNAIVPQIATEIGKAIIKAEEMNEWN